MTDELSEANLAHFTGSEPGTGILSLPISCTQTALSMLQKRAALIGCST